MGKLIPLFPSTQTEPNLPLTRDQTIRLRLILNSLTALQREETSVKEIIEKKCKPELDRLDTLALRIHELEMEADGIRKLGNARLHSGIYPGAPVHPSETPNMIA
ncbi:MAG: hypothetical protein HQM09_15790 [Candidatus Riflebacteria bacterium]|nr:hypothetical protein [Candidatus Riflebacteria bacterium]